MTATARPHEARRRMTPTTMPRPRARSDVRARRRARRGGVGLDASPPAPCRDARGMVPARDRDDDEARPPRRRPLHPPCPPHPPMSRCALPARRPAARSLALRRPQHRVVALERYMGPAARPAFANLLRNLRTGELRVGGSSQDLMPFEPAAANTIRNITPEDIGAVRATLDAVNAGDAAGAVPSWGTILGTALAPVEPERPWVGVEHARAFVLQGVEPAFAGRRGAPSRGHRPRQRAGSRRARARRSRRGRRSRRARPRPASSTIGPRSSIRSPRP